MKHLLTALLTVVMACLPIAADTYDPIYIASKSTTLSSAAEVITIQNPSSTRVKMTVLTVYVKCSVACDFTVERDGTAATSTSLAVDKASKLSPSPTGIAFSGSNVGSGSFRWPYSFPANSGGSIQFQGVDLPGDGSNSNFSVRVASMTGNVFVLIQWKES